MEGEGPKTALVGYRRALQVGAVHYFDPLDHAIVHRRVPQCQHDLGVMGFNSVHNPLSTFYDRAGIVSLDGGIAMVRVLFGAFFGKSRHILWEVSYVNFGRYRSA